jgi:5-methyltetrahydropteroyltriglutamate--homocysteine methyltransferase
MTAAPLKPPFRADQVGSLLRPAHLIEARGKLRKREIDAAALKAIEDAAIREVVALQEAIGLNSISDGEFRRQSYIVDFFRKALGSGGLTAEQGQFFHHHAHAEDDDAVAGDPAFSGRQRRHPA